MWGDIARYQKPLLKYLATIPLTSCSGSHVHVIQITLQQLHLGKIKFYQNEVSQYIKSIEIHI